MIKDCNQKPAESRHSLQDGREKRSQTDQWDSVSAENATLLETLRALALVVTPGEWEVSEGGGSIRAFKERISHTGHRGLYRSRIAFGFDGTAAQRAKDYELIVALRNALPTIIAALETVDLIRDEDWLASQIPASSRSDAYHYARAIIAGLEKETA